MEDEVIECEVCGSEWPEFEMQVLNETDGSCICPNCSDFDSKD